MYNGNLEWALTIRDLQYGPEFSQGPQDLQVIMAQIGAMQAAPLGEPDSQYDARSVYDSRPTNGFDATFSGNASAAPSTAWTVLFSAPLGYRVVVREWQVNYDAPGSGPAADSAVSLLLNGAALPYNDNIAIGMGTSDPVSTFFLVEENGTFGITGLSSNLALTTTAYVNMHVNLIPVTLDQLSFAVVNRKPGT